MISKILVAVDGSENARRALDSAMQLSTETKTALIILTVVQPPAIMGVQRDLLGTLEMLLEKEARIMLANYSTLAEKKGAKVETVIGRGYPSKVILKTAEDASANLIVVGSRGLSGIKELFLGSVSHAVVQNSTIPVLVVK